MKTPQFLPSKTPVVDERGFVKHDWLLNMMSWIQSMASAGDVDGPSSSSNSAIALFSGLTGKILKAATGTGVVHALAGVYSVGVVELSEGGTGESLADPNADRILFWDDSAAEVTWLAPGTNLSITGTTLNATAGAGASWIPLVDGSEPPAFITDGAGVLVLVAYGP